jgi:hypothetical protein
MKNLFYKLFILISLTTISFSQTYKLTGDKIFNLAADSVVLILGSNTNQSGMGSGVFVTYEGEIITNYHVIEGYESDELGVWIYEGFQEADRYESSKMIPVDIVATDKSKDLALLKIKKNIDDIVPIYLAYDEDILIGSQVFAIGHPGGMLWSFTEGIVNRIAYNEWNYGPVTASAGFFENLYNWWFDVEEDKGYIVAAKTIFTQTPINPGNSGGLLLNSDGNMVGINTYNDLTMNNVNGAVHIDEVEKFLIKNGLEVSDLLAQNEYVSDLSDLISNFVPIRNPEFDGYYFISKFEGADISIEFGVPRNDEEATYIGIDRNDDGYHDLILYDVDDDGSFSEWDIDLDMDGEFEWSGNIHNDKMMRFYRKFVSRIDSMLNDSFSELTRLGFIE